MAPDRTPGIRPRPTLWRRLDAASRQAFPVSSTVLLLLVLAGPLGLPMQAEWQQAAALAGVFFWSVFRPAAMAPPMVFLLGLLLDLLALAPPGLGVLTLLLAHGVAVRWRRELARQGFLVVWLAFVALAAAVAAGSWGVASALTFRVLPGAPMVFQFVLAAGLYPALAFVFTAAHRSAAAPEQA